MPRLRITSTLDPEELVQALAATAQEWDLAEALQERLGGGAAFAKARSASLDPWDWQAALVHMSQEARMPFADATLAAVEDQVVQATRHRVRHWALALMPWIAWSLTRQWNPDRLAAWERKTTLPDTILAPWTTAWQHAWVAGEAQARTPALRVIRPVPSGTSPEPRRDASERHATPATTAPTASGPKPPQEPPLPAPIPLLPAQQRKEAQWIAEQTAALQMREWADGMQADVRAQVVRAVQERLTVQALEARLADRWRVHGVNFRRIAVTELNAAYTHGMLLALPEYTTVYVAPIGDNRVCRECHRLLEGKYFTVLHAPPIHPTKHDRETCLWPAKTNRGKDRRDWDPCIPCHPFCRHTAGPVTQSSVGRR